MAVRALGNSSRRFMERFRSVPGGNILPGFMPTLRAFGGLSLWEPLGDPAAGPLARLGSLEVRVATTAAEVRKAQRLRYEVFYQEGGALSDAKTAIARRDVDAFDSFCEHLVVVDTGEDGQRRGKAKIVGTCRLLRQDVAQRHGGFYSAGEFDVDDLFARNPTKRFLEVGRSCVIAPYRNMRTLELMWSGIWAYVVSHNFDVLIGCGSLKGTDPAQLGLALAYLHHYRAAPETWNTCARPDRFVDMNCMPKEAIDVEAAQRMLPPLIRGYLRLGAFIGNGAAIDHQFGTTDVLIILPVSAMNVRFIEKLGQLVVSRAA